MFRLLREPFEWHAQSETSQSKNYWLVLYYALRYKMRSFTRRIFYSDLIFRYTQYWTWNEQRLYTRNDCVGHKLSIMFWTRFFNLHNTEPETSSVNTRNETSTLGMNYYWCFKIILAFLSVILATLRRVPYQ